LTGGGAGGDGPPVPLVLDLVRHGEAHPVGPDGDASRRLTPAGREKVVRLGSTLAERGWRPDRVFVSPLVRARESAALLIAPLEPVPALEALDALIPDHDPEDVLESLADRAVSSGTAALVGHQPLLGRLLALLTGGPERALGTGTLVRVECPDGPGSGGARVILELV
jgi:phosphohistidine phosphatase